MGNSSNSTAAAVAAAVLATSMAGVGSARASASPPSDAPATAVALPQVGAVSAPITGLTGGTGLTPVSPARGTLPGAGIAAGMPMAHIKWRVTMRVFQGVVTSIDKAADRLVVSVRRGRHGTRTMRSAIEFLVGGARMEVRDRNGDGDRDLADIKRGDHIRLKALVGRGTASAREPLEARVVTSPALTARWRHDGPSRPGQLPGA